MMIGLLLVPEGRNVYSNKAEHQRQLRRSDMLYLNLVSKIA